MPLHRAMLVRQQGLQVAVLLEAMSACLLAAFTPAALPDCGCTGPAGQGSRHRSTGVSNGSQRSHSWAALSPCRPGPAASDGMPRPGLPHAETSAAAAAQGGTRSTRSTARPESGSGPERSNRRLSVQWQRPGNRLQRVDAVS